MVLNHGGEWVAPSPSATSLHLYVVLVISILKSQEKQRQAQQKVQGLMSKVGKPVYAVGMGRFLLILLAA